MNHSPGPWELFRGYDGSKTVCTMRSCDENVSVRTAGDVTPRPHEATDANANLIAALTPTAERRQRYLSFLASKIPTARIGGFEPPCPAHESLRTPGHQHQHDIALWAIRGGQRAIFAKFGLGKTRINLQLGWWVAAKTGGKYLIICPLGARHVFTDEDGPAMGYPVHFVRTNAEVQNIKGRIFITNYETVRDGKIDVSQFAGVGLDESSVLRSFGSKTYQTFLQMFKSVPYRFVFTATPSPNRYKELIHYAAFLGIMDSGEALTRFFQRDSEQANNLTLYPHMETQFWYWMHSWACFLQQPSDLGYSDQGYDLPEMEVIWHRLEVDHTQAWNQTDSWGQTQLFKDNAQGLKESAEAKRESIALRVAKAKELITHAPMGKHWLLWHDLEDERREIERTMPTVTTVYGTQDLDEREALILGFGRGQYRMLATKPIIAGSGCNFQKHCHAAIFIGVGYKFNDFIQAIHRIHRFQQKKRVEIHIIHLASEDSIVAKLQEKWRNHNDLMAKMTALLKQFSLSGLSPSTHPQPQALAA